MICFIGSLLLYNDRSSLLTSMSHDPMIRSQGACSKEECVIQMSELLVLALYAQFGISHAQTITM